MKIISKYKDFYDYYFQDYNADLVWERKQGTIEMSEEVLKLLNKNFPYWRDPHYDFETIIIESKKLVLFFGGWTFGIFPNLYSQPYIGVSLPDGKCNRIMLDETICEGIQSKDPELQEMVIKDIYPKLIAASENQLDEIDLKQVYNKLADLIDEIVDLYATKATCSAVFYEIGYPVFTLAYNELYKEGLSPSLYDCDPKMEEEMVVYNSVFTNLEYNLLALWGKELRDGQTYINIESFLSTQDQKPIPEPSNKAKIVSHGFDIKTSFRKA